MTVDDVMDRTSSTQFLKWQKFLDDREWLGKPTRAEHQMAVVAREVFRIALMLGGKGNKLPDMDTFLVKFNTDAPQKEDQPEYLPDGSRWAFKPPPMIPLKDIKGDVGIHVGQPLDAKWQAINDHAKAEWAAFLGPCLIKNKEG